MDQHVKNYFCQFSDQNPQGQFHKVIVLNDIPDGDFDLIARRLPPECKGWLELAQLPLSDRIELMKEFWMCKMKEHPRFIQFLLTFFDTICDIDIFITQHHFDDPLECHMVYSLPNDTGFFRGKLPATENQVLGLQDYFSEWVLPSDYIAFLQVHDGFAKTTDCTGVTPSDKLIESYERFQNYLNEHESLHTTLGKDVDPRTLIPFYESFGMPYYQCFWGEWHPEAEMGNVYYSSLAHTINDPDSNTGNPEQMAFPTFADWLIFYLERVS